MVVRWWCVVCRMRCCWFVPAEADAGRTPSRHGADHPTPPPLRGTDQAGPSGDLTLFSTKNGRTAGACRRRTGVARPPFDGDLSICVPRRVIEGLRGWPPSSAIGWPVPWVGSELVEPPLSTWDSTRTRPAFGRTPGGRASSSCGGRSCVGMLRLGPASALHMARRWSAPVAP